MARRFELPPYLSPLVLRRRLSRPCTRASSVLRRNPKRCSLPITALRERACIAIAIMLPLSRLAHRSLSSATRSGVHQLSGFMGAPRDRDVAGRRRGSPLDDEPAQVALGVIGHE